MAPDTWLPQILLAAAFLAAYVQLMRGQVFVPIADPPPSQQQVVPANTDGDDEEHLARRPQGRPRFRWQFLPAMVVLTAAVRIAFLVALHR